jgi:cholesterol transport system auxiliary component
VLESNEPPVQSYVLRAEAGAAAVSEASGNNLPVMQVEAVQTGPGLDSDHIVLLRADRRFDSYAGSRWADEMPQMIEALVVDSLRDSGAYRAVFGDAAPFPADYTIAVTVRRFEADYTDSSAAPTVQVALDVAVGRRSDRALLAAFSSVASAAATENRMSAVVAAFERATQSALRNLREQTLAATQKLDSPDASIKR